MRCLVQPDRRSPLASVFHSFLTGADTEPRESSATREAPQSPFGALLQQTRGLPIQPRHLPPTRGLARQPLRTASRIPRSWRRLAAGRSRVRAEGESRSTSAGDGEPGPQPQWGAWRRRSAGAAERGLELGLQPLGSELEAGSRAGAGPTHGAHARAHVAAPGGRHLPAAAALSSGSPAC